MIFLVYFVYGFKLLGLNFGIQPTQNDKIQVSKTPEKEKKSSFVIFFFLSFFF